MNLTPSTGTARTERVKVVVLDDYQNVARHLAHWTDARHPLSLHCVHEHVNDDDELFTVLQDAEVIVAMRERTPLRAPLLSRLPRLRLIVTTGMRNPVIDQVPGVTVCGTRGLASPTVELTWALILGLARNVSAEEASLRAGTWQQGLGVDLEGKALGIFGLGRIGTRVAAVGRAFGMNVIAWSQNLTAAEAAARGADRVEADELFRASDILSVHVQLSDRTRGFIDERRLRLMRRDALLVNTSRSAVVDQPALLDALREGRLAGVGLDVFDEEPLRASAPILKAPRTLLTPHLGYVTRENYRMFYGDALEDIEAFLDGSPIRVVDGGAGA